MIYVESIRIRNFESHKDTYIEFHPGINVITGESNVGKSAILRALRLVFYNEPCGDESIRLDKDYIERRAASERGGAHQMLIVTVKLSDGHIIERSKSIGSGVNRYILTYPDGRTQEFNNFRNEVPEEIRDALRFSYIWVGKDKFEANYMPQMDLPILEEYQGANLSTLINKLNGVDEFEEILRTINRSLHHTGTFATEEKIISDRIIQRDAELSVIPNYAVEIDVFETDIIPSLKRAETLENNVNLATTIIARAHDVRKRHGTVNKELKRLSAMCELTRYLPSVDELSDNIQTSETLISKSDKVNARLKVVDDQICRLSAVADLSVTPLKEAIDRYQEGDHLIRRGTSIIKEQGSISSKITSAEDALVDLIENRWRLYVDFINEHKTCPTCRQPLTEDALSHVIEHVEGLR